MVETSVMKELNSYLQSLTHFLADDPILYTLKTPKNQGLLVFAGGIKW